MRHSLIATAAALCSTALLLVPAAARAILDPGPAQPRLLLDTTGMADDVDPGDVFATLGSVALFYLVEEFEGEQKGPLFTEDDTLRIPLWRTDGTPEGTYPLLPPNASFFFYSDRLDGVAFFAACKTEGPILLMSEYGCDSAANVELWRTDGTREGTYRLLEDNPARRFVYSPFPASVTVPELGLFFFSTSGAETGRELWVSDGTRQGTRVIKNFTSAGFLLPGRFVSRGGELVFVVIPEVDGSPLWLGRSDGTSKGTTFFPSPIENRPSLYELVPGGDKLFVLGDELQARGYDPPSGDLKTRPTLWSLGTREEEFLRLGDLGERVGTVDQRTRAAAGRVFVQLYEQNDNALALWGSDGTADSVELLARLAGSARIYLSPRTEPLDLPWGRAFLGMTDGAHGLEPWTSDGTVEGTGRLADLCPGECDSAPWGITTAGGSRYIFGATDGVHGHEPWRWEPATGRVEPIADLCPGKCSGGSRLVGEVAENRLLLAANDPGGDRDLWAIDPAGSGGRLVADLGDLEIDIFEFFSGFQNILWGLTDDHWIFWGRRPGTLALWSVPVNSPASAPPPGPALTSDELPGFAVKVRIDGLNGIQGRKEPDCLAETLCISGAVAGRSEVFVRVVGPKGNGRLWPTLVKFTTSTVDVWIEQLATGIVRHYQLEGASPGSFDLPGLFDRDGFPPG